MRIRDISIENVRGFTNTEFNLDNENIIFVGPNNTGKTSILILLNWFFNELTEEYLYGEDHMPEHWQATLIPARETRNRARRITLSVEIDDGRKRRKYPYLPNDDCVRLRLNIRLSPLKVVARLNLPTRGEPFESEYRAIDLISDLQNEFNFNYISPFRGHSGEDLRSMLRLAYQKELDLWIDQLAPNSNEFKSLRDTASQLSEKSSEILYPLVEKIIFSLPAGIRPTTSLNPNIDVKSLLELAAKSATLNLSTGTHDQSYVDPSKVGSGLRSLLELSVKTGVKNHKKLILAVEEPEAFLHPLAQRMLAKELYSLDAYKRLISTHSPTIVEESDLTGVVLVNAQQFYPFQSTDAMRLEINSAFLKKHSAELLFSKSILLVEGESDFFFFEIIKERLLKADKEGILNGLYVLPVGSNTNFIPYVKLIDGFGEYEHPIKWLIVPDGDSHSILREIIRGLDSSVTSDTESQLQVIADHYRNRHISKWIAATKQLNRILINDGYRITLMPADLEYTILENANEDLISSVKAKANSEQERSKDDLLLKLGSKGVDGRSRDNANKGPHIRAHIARNISGKEISTSLKTVLRVWTSPLGVSNSQLDRLIDAI